MGTVLHNCNRATGRVSLDSYSRVSVYEWLFAYCFCRCHFLNMGLRHFKLQHHTTVKDPDFR